MQKVQLNAKYLADEGLPVRRTSCLDGILPVKTFRQKKKFFGAQNFSMSH